MAPISFVVLCIGFLSFLHPSSIGENNDCITTNRVFSHGEKLVYKLYYTLGFIWVPAGEVYFHVEENSDTYALTAVGKTYDSYSRIFKVNDYFYSKVDKATLQPNNFVRIIEEGNYRLFDSVHFDKEKNIAVSFHGKTKDKARPEIHRMDDCMQDIISNIYSLRNAEVDKMYVGEQKSVKLFFDKEIFPVGIRYGGKENKGIKDLGTFKTLKIHPDVVAGNVFKKGDQMTLWISDDKNKIPLLIESPVSIGKIKAVLKSYSGLRYGLTSQITD